MRLTPSGYAHLLQMLSCVADGKILMLINVSLVLFKFIFLKKFKKWKFYFLHK